MLQRRDRLGAPDVRFAAEAELVVAADFEVVLQDRRIAERFAVTAERLLGDLGEAGAFDGPSPCR